MGIAQTLIIVFEFQQSTCTGFHRWCRAFNAPAAHWMPSWVKFVARRRHI